MRIELKWSALLVVGILAVCAGRTLGWGDGACAASVMLVCIILHEVAHITVARRFALRVKVLGLCAKGAYTIRERSNDRATEIMIALAGPVMNMLLFAAFASIPGKAAAWVAAGNLILWAGNLVPIGSTDGWRIWKLLTSA